MKSNTQDCMATRYRPKKLSELLGQPHTVQVVRGMLSGSIPRTILIDGPYGTGKTSLARLIAHAVNCLDRKEGDLCGECAYCVEIQKGNDPGTIHELNGAEARGIDESRKLINTAQYMPRGHQYRVFILDEVQQLTAEAFKALLKILEEPPKHTIFILCTTEPGRIPPEIRSRMLRLVVRSVEPDVLSKHLRRIAKAEQHVIGIETAQKIARASRGHVRDAINILEAFCCAAKSAENTDPDNLLESLLVETSDALALDYVAALHSGEIETALLCLNRVRNHALFCEASVRVATHMVRSYYDRSGKLRDPHMSDLYDRYDHTNLSQKVHIILVTLNGAATRVKQYQTNDPYAIMVEATVMAAGSK